MSSEPLKVGILLVGPVQLLDLAAIDLLYMTTPSYLTTCSLPSPLIAQSRPCEIYYIGKDSAGSTQSCTSNLTLTLTNTLSDPIVSPGSLDVLFIPGPEPDHVPEEAYLDFLRSHFDAGTEIMSICTGVFVSGYAGILDGKKVTGPRALVPVLRKKFPKVESWDDKVRVVRDGKLWTCGGITNGHDLVAQYLRENYPAALVNTVLAMADVPERRLEYDTGVASDNMFFLWQILRALPSAVFRMIRSG